MLLVLPGVTQELNVPVPTAALASPLIVPGIYVSVPYALVNDPVTSNGLMMSEWWIGKNGKLQWPKWKVYSGISFRGRQRKCSQKSRYFSRNLKRTPREQKSETLFTQITYSFSECITNCLRKWELHAAFWTVDRARVIVPLPSSWWSTLNKPLEWPVLSTGPMFHLRKSSLHFDQLWNLIVFINVCLSSCSSSSVSGFRHLTDVFLF
jgi:hypothetical protein